MRVQKTLALLWVCFVGKLLRVGLLVRGLRPFLHLAGPYLHAEVGLANLTQRACKPLLPCHTYLLSLVQDSQHFYVFQFPVIPFRIRRLHAELVALVVRADCLHPLFHSFPFVSGIPLFLSALCLGSNRHTNLLHFGSCGCWSLFDGTEAKVTLSVQRTAPFLVHPRVASDLPYLDPQELFWLRPQMRLRLLHVAHYPLPRLTI
mmetsp:Transcript_112531/g.195307  ORF Transcript_112531/g.195307 Transcript_112531/m.195307 type:complete len:204 (-) Transcript_112531:337-948(-)